MQLYELVNKYHVGTTLSCAEAMFKACNEYYGLNLPENTRKMFSIMGIGMQTQLSCCGAFTVAVGIIGLVAAQDGQTLLLKNSARCNAPPCTICKLQAMKTPATLLWKKLPKSWKNCLPRTSCTNILTTTCNKPGIQKALPNTDSAFILPS